MEEAPSSWPARKKWTVLVTASLVCFVVGINSTAVLSAVDEISTNFNVDLESFDYSFFLVTAWNAGAAFLPLLLLPTMEDFGVRPIYITVYVVFFIFVVVQSVAPNFATLIVSRVIAGSCGGVLQNAVDGMAADVWASDSKRLARSMTMFVFALLGGVTVGPVIGGVIIRSLGWRWILYIQLVIYAVVFVLVVFLLHETRRKEKEDIKPSIQQAILRSSRMLCTEGVLSSFTLWSSFAFGTVFLLTQSIPLVYSALGGWPEWTSGVIQVAIFIGEMIGVLLCIFQDSIISPRFSFAEARLYTAIPASFFGLAAGLFIYAWTSSGQPWPLPTLGLLLIGTGIMVIVQSVSTYITEFYGPLANSAVSAVAFGENCFAAFLPLATRTMYRNLGFSWASSLLGSIALIISLAPVVLVMFRSQIRARDRR